VKIHKVQENENNEKKLSFDGMVKFYGNILSKLKEKRDEKIEKQKEQQTQTIE